MGKETTTNPWPFSFKIGSAEVHDSVPARYRKEIAKVSKSI